MIDKEHTIKEYFSLGIAHLHLFIYHARLYIISNGLKMRIRKDTGWLRCAITCLLSVVVLASLILSSDCGNKSTTPTSGISLKFTNYTDKSGLFSISYPSDWELALSSLRDVNAAEQNVINAINSDSPVESAQSIFQAEKEPGSRPAVFISVESVPVTEWTYDNVVATYSNEIKQSNMYSISYNSFSQTNTTVKGREATIFDLDYNIGPRSPTGPDDIVVGPAPYTTHDLRMLVLVDKTIWIVDCIPQSPDDFSKWKSDFEKIVKSLRVYK